MVKPGRLFVGNLSQNVRQKELEDAFSKWGEVATVDKKYDFAFVEYKDSRDAQEAIQRMDGWDLDGRKIQVQQAHQPVAREHRDNYDRGGGGDRGGPDRGGPDRGGHDRGGGGGGGGPPPRRPYHHRPPPRGPNYSDVCFNCGRKGHWANQCREGDWSNKCYRCGNRGHLRRDCKASSRSIERELPRFDRHHGRPPPRYGGGYQRHRSGSMQYSGGRGGRGGSRYYRGGGGGRYYDRYEEDNRRYDRYDRGERGAGPPPSHRMDRQSERGGKRYHPSQSQEEDRGKIRGDSRSSHRSISTGRKGGNMMRGGSAQHRGNSSGGGYGQGYGRRERADENEGRGYNGRQARRNSPSASPKHQSPKRGPFNRSPSNSAGSPADPIDGLI